MRKDTQSYGIDREYLRRCKESTPAQRLDWLAAAREFALMPKKKARKKGGIS